jgi:raffinose/stachyose/melibiose transport system substrate-binding protein
VYHELQILKEKVMNKSFRVALLLVVAVLALSVGAASAQDDVVIQWWHIQTGDPGLTNWQTLADQFSAENPNVTFEITVLENEAFKARLVTVMQAGDPPDLFQSWGGGVLRTFADNGLVRNIAPELEEWKDTIAAQAALDLYGQNGEYYGVPWTWGAVGMFYNKALFEQAGLDPENPPATWTEFLDAVQTLKDAGITPLSLGEGDKWPGHFWWVYLAIRLGGEDAFLAAYSREGSFADEPFVQAGEHLMQLIALEPFPEGYLAMTYGDQETVFGNGEAAMELTSCASSSARTTNARCLSKIWCCRSSWV